MMRKLGDFDPHLHSLILDSAEIQQLAESIGRQGVDWTGVLANVENGQVVSLWASNWDTPYSLYSEYEQVI
jgi:hypothetical protein